MDKANVSSRSIGRFRCAKKNLKSLYWGIVAIVTLVVINDLAMDGVIVSLLLLSITTLLNHIKRAHNVPRMWRRLIIKRLLLL